MKRLIKVRELSRMRSRDEDDRSANVVWEKIVSCRDGDEVAGLGKHAADSVAMRDIWLDVCRVRILGCLLILTDGSALIREVVDW